jgi:hypothetical protein
MRVGDEVTAGPFGTGKIVSVSRSSVIVKLDSNGLDVEIPLADLGHKGGPAPAGRALTPEVEHVIGRVGSGVADQEIQDCLAIEALRFGLVPEHKLEELTIEYSGLRQWIISRLPKPGGTQASLSQVCGPFGSGKSHAMAAVRHIANQSNHITARVEVDGEKISLAFPENLLYALWSSLSGSDLHPYTALLDLCRTAIEANQPPPNIAPRGIDRIQDNYITARQLRRPESLEDHGYELNAVMSSSDEFTASDVARSIKNNPYISPYDVRVRRMIGRDVESRPFDFLEALIGYAKLSELAGYAGLVITIDEFEIERGSAYQDRIIDLFNTLAKYWKGDLDHPDVPLSMFFATLSTDGSIGDRVINRLVPEDHEGFYLLPVWTKRHRREFSRSVFDLYSRAYGVDEAFDAAITDRVEQTIVARGEGGAAVMRSFAKDYVAALDSTYRPMPI